MAKYPCYVEDNLKMLIGLNPLLNTDAFYALRATRHGDDLIVADIDFPSNRVARQTVCGKVLLINDSMAQVISTLIGLLN